MSADHDLAWRAYVAYHSAVGIITPAPANDRIRLESNGVLSAWAAGVEAVHSATYGLVGKIMYEAVTGTHSRMPPWELLAGTEQLAWNRAGQVARAVRDIAAPHPRLKIVPGAEHDLSRALRILNEYLIDYPGDTGVQEARNLLQASHAFHRAGGQ